MKKTFLFVLLIAGLKTPAQDFSLYEKRWYVNGTDSLPYRLLLPVNYNTNNKYPLIIVLHGSGERGNDNESQLTHGGKLFIRDDVRRDFPAIVVFPQCGREARWSREDYEGEATVPLKLTQELIEQLVKQYPVNKRQVYIGGLSMGGSGTYEIVARNPTLFAAAFPSSLSRCRQP